MRDERRKFEALREMIAQKRYGAALDLARAFAAAFPRNGSGWKTLGALLWWSENHEDALVPMQNSARLLPADPETHSNFGMALMHAKRIDEAVESFERALRLDDTLAGAHYNLGMARLQQGRYADAQTSLTTAVALRPEYLSAEVDPCHPALLFLYSHDASIGADTLFAEHCSFGREIENRMSATQPLHSHLADPERRLRVGFVSGDLRNHAVASFLEPVLERLCKYPGVELHAFYNETVEDEVSVRLRAHFKSWHSVALLTDSALTDLIMRQRIDILIDLSGPTSLNRLRALARKPAPIQVSWIGYPGTTGLRAMDYYFADQHWLPPGQFDRHFVEKLVYLPANAIFQPEPSAPLVAVLPALQTGHFTFGSFNRLGKINAETIRLWSKLLSALPGSKLILAGIPLDGQHIQLMQKFAAEGVDRNRLTFHAHGRMDTYLALHHQVDLCLDTFPYNGGTTTFHALWMGVPTLTMTGTTPAGRQGAGILGLAGLDEFIAVDTADFVAKGLHWAARLNTLADLRAGLRERCRQSASQQPDVLVAALEQALRRMWRRWCANLPAESFEIPAAELATSYAQPLPAGDSTDLDEACGKAMHFQLSGRSDLAERIYAEILRSAPTHAVASHCLGMLNVQLLRPSTGLPYLRAALNANPALPDYWLGYIEALLQAGELEDACQTFALARQHGLEGAAVDDLAQRLDALTHPQDAALLVLIEQRRFDEARAQAAAMTEKFPEHGFGWKILGAMLWSAGRGDEALGAMRTWARLMPTDAETHSNLGMILAKSAQFEEADVHLNEAIEIDPTFAAARYRQGMSFELQGRYADAEVSLRSAIALRSDSLTVDDVQGYSNLLYVLCYSPQVDADALFNEHRRVGAEFEAGLQADWPRHRNIPDPDRRLKVGLVSGDLRNHAVATFLEPVLAHLCHDENCDLHAYSTCNLEDEVTARLRGYVRHWNPVANLADADFAQMIIDDGIDILVDLSGHTGMNRLRTFARKPAPIQVSWLGYPGTTGLTAMDYYLADKYWLPPGQFEAQFTEKLVYLPSNVPFQPHLAAPAVNPLPALATGAVTFGSFNRLGKINLDTIRLWSELLRDLPTSTLLLGGLPLHGPHSQLLEQFAANGIAPERLKLHPRGSMGTYLALHHQVDICLDTFPYTGGTTTNHALWMGVPTLTIAGRTPAARQGAAALGLAGLEGFIASDHANFIEKGIHWTGRLAALADIRAGLRQRCSRSLPHQPAVIVAGLERALRHMWKRWCAGLPPESFHSSAAAGGPNLDNSLFDSLDSRYSS